MIIGIVLVMVMIWLRIGNIRSVLFWIVATSAYPYYMNAHSIKYEHGWYFVVFCEGLVHFASHIFHIIHDCLACTGRGCTRMLSAIILWYRLSL